MQVAIFEDCEPSLLRDLVIRLQLTQCCPGDKVCYQGEVGNEMYIVNKGLLQVQVDGDIVATLSAGNHFGEISILDIEGVGNRRTASIISLGFSQLFKLSKNDLQEVSPYYRRSFPRKNYGLFAQNIW
jgi:CRP-like cAMP-binding protein